MVQVDDGDVRNLHVEPGYASDTGIGSTNRMDIPQTDLMNTLQAAMLLRGEIRCRLTTKFACGYEIRPIMWFAKRTPEIDSTLGMLGLEWRNPFVKTEDITKLCHAFRNFFNLSTKSFGLKMVDSLNGILPQPLEHEEVLEALAQIEKHGEALNTHSPSDKSQRR